MLQDRGKRPVWKPTREAQTLQGDSYKLRYGQCGKTQELLLKTPDSGHGPFLGGYHRGPRPAGQDALKWSPPPNGDKL